MHACNGLPSARCQSWPEVVLGGALQWATTLPSHYNPSLKHSVTISPATAEDEAGLGWSRPYN